MTKISSPSQARREGTPFSIDFAKYLEHIVQIDPDIKSVCIKLDEEGNEYWELNTEETQLLIKTLQQAVKDIST